MCQFSQIYSSIKSEINGKESNLVSDKGRDGFPSLRRPLSLLLFLSFWHLKAGQGHKNGPTSFKPISSTCIAETYSCATFNTSSTEFSSPSFTHLSLVEAMYWHTERRVSKECFLGDWETYRSANGGESSRSSGQRLHWKTWPGRTAQ